MKARMSSRSELATPQSRATHSRRLLSPGAFVRSCPVSTTLLVHAKSRTSEAVVILDYKAQPSELSRRSPIGLEPPSRQIPATSLRASADASPERGNNQSTSLPTMLQATFLEI